MRPENQSFSIGEFTTYLVLALILTTSLCFFPFPPHRLDGFAPHLLKVFFVGQPFSLFICRCSSSRRRGSASGRLPTGGGGRGGRAWPLLVVWDRFVLRSRSSSGLSLFHQSLPKVRQLAVVPVRATTGLTSTCLLVVR